MIQRTNETAGKKFIQIRVGMKGNSKSVNRKSRRLSLVEFGDFRPSYDLPLDAILRYDSQTDNTT